MNNPLITSSAKRNLTRREGKKKKLTAKCRPEFDIFNQNFSSVCGQNDVTAKSTNLKKV